MRRDDLEEEDHVESYVNMMRRKGVDVSKLSHTARGGDVDSDEEVYATARAIDAQDQDSDDGVGSLSEKRKDIEPLAPIGMRRYK